jgi:hypothetical protein
MTNEEIMKSRQPGGVNEVDPIVAQASQRATSAPPAPGRFTSLSTSFPQLREGCADPWDRMTNFTPRGMFHLPAHSTRAPQTPTPGGGDGG